jgi:DNA-binding HxlR family transcriptional regulator
LDLEPGTDAGFDNARAEVFEAIGHPARIKILQALEGRPLGFSELKRAVGIESSGHMSFHLGKLEGLVKAGGSGDYVLTDDGREALRMIQATRSEHRAETTKVSVKLPRASRVLVVALVVGLIILAAAAAVQQQEIVALNGSISSARSNIDQMSASESSQLSRSVLVGGVRYWYLSLPLATLENNRTLLTFDGVQFEVSFPITPIGLYVTFHLPVNATTDMNGTFTLTITGKKGASVSGCGQSVSCIPFSPLPLVEFTFPDGSTENTATSNFTPLPQGLQSLNASANSTVWFSGHTDPQAGVMVDDTNRLVTLFVSVR